MNKLNILGKAALSLMIAAPTMTAAADTWKPIGEGMLRDDILTFWYIFDSYHEFKVEVQESNENPGRYRLVNAYRNFPNWPEKFPADYTNYLIVDATDKSHVYIEKGLAGIYSGYDQAMMVWSQAADYYNNKYGDWKKADEEGVCGKCVDGIITFPPNAILVTPYDIPEDKTLRWDGAVPEDGPEVGFNVANSKGMFRLKLPGAPNVDVSGDFGALSADGSSVEYTVNLGSDVEYAKVAIINGPYAARLEDKVATGEIPSTTITKGGTFSTPFDNDGQHTLVVVPYFNGNAHQALTYTREWNYKSDWESIGLAEFTEAILGSCEMTKEFAIGEYTYFVEAERCKSNPNLVRLVDPYKEAYPESGRNDCDFSKRHCLVFDITDPEFVLLKQTEDGIGYQIGAYGIIEIWSRADREIILRGKSPAEVKSLGYGGSISSDNELTFPKDMLLVRWPLVRPPMPNGSDWYWANRDAKFSIKFDKRFDLSALPAISSPTLDSPERLFNLQGVEVKDTPTPGIYISLKNGVSRKIVIR